MVAVVAVAAELLQAKEEGMAVQAVAAVLRGTIIQAGKEGLVVAVAGHKTQQVGVEVCTEEQEEAIPV
jgi:predicted membrane GTPase involved in stress response